MGIENSILYTKMEPYFFIGPFLRQLEVYERVCVFLLRFGGQSGGFKLKMRET